METIIIILIATMIAIFLFKKDQKEEAERKEQEDIKKRTMPDGNLVPEDDVLLEMKDEEFEAYDRPNLMFIINYVAYREIEGIEAEKPYWRNLFERLTKIKNLKHWW